MGEGQIKHLKIIEEIIYILKSASHDDISQDQTKIMYEILRDFKEASKSSDKLDLKNDSKDSVESLELNKNPSNRIYERFKNLLSPVDKEYIESYRDLDFIYLPVLRRHTIDIIKFILSQKVENYEGKYSLLYKGRKAAQEEMIVICERYNIRSIFERDAIQQTINLFAKQYDLEDPRVFMVVRSVLNHQLSSLRLQQLSMNRGILQEHHDREGNLTYVLNPTEEAKLKFDNSIIKAIAELEHTLKGQKVTLEGEVTFKDLMKRVFDITPKTNESKLLNTSGDEVDD